MAVASVIMPFALSAQTDPLFTHFTFNKLFYNPACAGVSDQFCVNAITHQQWLGYDDESAYLKTQNPQLGVDKVLSNMRKNIAPKTNGFGISLPALYKGKNYGGGSISFVTDKIGYESTTYMKGGLAGSMPLPDGSTIRVGIDFANITKSLDGAGLRAHDANDPLIPVGVVSDNHTTLGAGLYFMTPNIMDGSYLGISSTNVNPQKFVYGGTGTVVVTTNRHFYIVGGTKMNNFMGNPSLTLDPAFLIKTTMGKGGLVKPEVDVQGLVTWNDLFAGGANLRFYGAGIDALSFILGYYPPLLGNSASSSQKLRVGYSYDLTMSHILRNSAGSHELQVNYCFMFTLPERPVKVYRHPRWMERPAEWD